MSFVSDGGAGPEPEPGRTDAPRRAKMVQGPYGALCPGLITDLYELTMAASYLRRSMTQTATFSLFVRRLPAERNFLVAAGIENVLALLESFFFDEQALSWLASQGFDSEAIEAFGAVGFTGDVWAVPEGRIVFADEPLVEITAPLPEAQLVESLVLNQMTYQTALATKAVRCALAADGRAELVDFSLRRTHGIEAGMAAARASSIAGFLGTSNVGAARHFGLRPVGTMAHSYVTAFSDEREAFTAFASDFPDRATFLVDTYDTLAGVEVAIEVIESMGLEGNLGVRLDSGDLLDLSHRSRRLLDQAGHADVSIVASGGLDEHEVKRLLDLGAPIDVFGVGTKVGVAADAPALDSAYKLVELDGRPLMKLSSGKRTWPGPKQVYRTTASSDVIATRSEPHPARATPLLVPVMESGTRVAAPEPVAAARQRLQSDLDWLPSELRSLTVQRPSPTKISAELEALTERTSNAIAGRQAHRTS